MHLVGCTIRYVFDLWEIFMFTDGEVEERKITFGIEEGTLVHSLSIWNGKLHLNHSGFGGSMLAFGTQVRGFAPGRSRRIFRAKKILGTPSFGGEVKPSVPCRSFTARKRSLNVT